MTIRSGISLVLLMCAAIPLAAAAQHSESAVHIQVANPTDQARPDEVVSLSWPDLQSRLPGLVRDAVRVMEVSSDTELPTQVLDADGDGRDDELLVLVDLRPSETRTFTVESRAPSTPVSPRAYVMHHEGRDDVAWESDRIAFRTYGQGLWALESLVSSGIDVWMKRVDDLVLARWYDEEQTESYHVDTGEGADYFAVGPTLGNGGNAVWVDGMLYRPQNFSGHRILANGPIRAIFELTYEPFEAGGREVAQTRKITIDAGKNLYREDLTFTADDAGSLEVAVGFVKRPDGLVGSMNHDSSFAWLSVWGPTTRSTGGHGDLGGGLVKLSDAPLDVREMADHFVALFDATPGETLTHYVGAGWTPSGQFDSVEDWWAHLNDFGARLATPVRITFVD